jgi:hypothetical protein
MSRIEDYEIGLVERRIRQLSKLTGYDYIDLCNIWFDNYEDTDFTFDEFERITLERD